MHFNSISSCDLGAVVTVSALNNSADDKHLYLPALNNFIAVTVGNNVVAASSETRIVVPAGTTVEISLLAPSVNLATVFYEYAASNIIDDSDKSAGYFSVTAKSLRDPLQVLNSEKSKKWYNYSTKSHSFVYYDQSAVYPITPSAGSSKLIVPAHIVPDPYTEKTYIYSSENGRLISSVPSPRIGIKPFAYKKVVVTPDVLFTDLSSLQYAVTGSVTKSTLAPVTGRYSAKFNGVTDYLVTNSTVLDLSNQDFTIEFWIYPADIPAINMSNWINNRDIVTTLIHNGVDTALGFGATDLFLVIDGAIILTAAHGFVQNYWYHIAFSRKNNAITIFVNGIAVKSAYYEGSVAGGTKTYIGTRAKINGYFKGHLTNIQIIKGQTVYVPSTYTVPTSTYSVGSDTLFSLGLAAGSYVDGQSVNTSLVDLKNRNAVTAINNITASTTVTKFGTRSFYFNDAGLQIVDSLVPSVKSIINSSSVTIEWWAYLVNSTMTQSGIHCGLITNFNNFSFLFGNQNYIVYANSTTSIFANTRARAATTYGSWKHYAIVKQAGTYKFYLDGELQFVGKYDSITLATADTLYFGADATTTSTFKGYIDGFVIKTTSNEVVNTFTPNTTLTVNANAILALDFATVSSQSLTSTTRIENYVFILTTDGTVTKVRVDNSTVASPKLPNSQASKKINWFLNSGLAFNEDLAYIGTFIDGSQTARSRTLSPGISCVDYYSGTVYVGGVSGIWVMDGETLDVLGIITTNFGISSIKAISSGFLVTTVNHKIYYLTLTGTPYLIYTSTVLGLPDALGNEWFVPDCEQSRLVVINLTTDFVANFNNSTSNISRYVNLDAIFAPSYVAADTSQNLIFICGHDSDVVYYGNGVDPLSSMIFDNKVAWISANSGTLIASFYLIDAIVLDVASLQRSAKVYLDARTGPTKASIGTKSFLIKMLGRHTSVQITAPGLSNSTMIRLPNGTVFSNGDPVKPSWIQDFENGQISTWANGVRESTDVAHDDKVSISYKSFDTGVISVSIPYIVGDRHTIFLPTVDLNRGAPKNFFNTKKPNLQPYSTDASCVLLLHMNGLSGSKYFQDDSITPTVYLGTGTVALNNAQSKFDGSSALFGGGYITVNANTNLGFGTGDFTIEFWIKTATTGATSKLLVPGGRALGKWAVYLDATGALVWYDGATENTAVNKSLYTNTWRHVAITRSSLTTTLYIDGSPEIAFHDGTDYNPAGIGDYLIGGGSTTYGTPDIPVYQTGDGIWASVAGTESTFFRNITVKFPTTGSYVFSCSINSYGIVTLDGTRILTIPMVTVTHKSGLVTINVTAGNHTIGINATRTNGLGVGKGAVQILIVSTTGTVVYDTNPAFSNLASYAGYIDELRISTVARYNGAVFKPGVPNYAVSSPVRPTNLLNAATFELPLTRMFTPGVAALEYGVLYVNGVLYSGNTLVNGFDTITVVVPFLSDETVFAPILRIGVKEFALPINNFNQELTEIVIEITDVDTNTRVDYTGNVTIAVEGTYYIPNYSTAFVTAIKQNGTTLVPGTYVTLSTGDSIDIYGILSSPRINDTVDVFIIGPENYQITVQTKLAYLPKYMDFGILLTKNQYSGDPLVQIGYSTVGGITDPFARFKYRSSPITVTGIPPNDETGDPQPIKLTTDQAFMGATVMRTKPNGDITQQKIVTDVVNGDTIQIVKQLYNYLETGIKLQVLYVDEDANAPSLFAVSLTNSVMETYDVGHWAVVQSSKTIDFTSPANGILDEPVNSLHDPGGNYISKDLAVAKSIPGKEIQTTLSKYELLTNNELLANNSKSIRYHESTFTTDRFLTKLAPSASAAQFGFLSMNQKSGTFGSLQPTYALNAGVATRSITNRFQVQPTNAITTPPRFAVKNSNYLAEILENYAAAPSNLFTILIKPDFTTNLANAFEFETAFTTNLANAFLFKNEFTTNLANAFLFKNEFTTNLANAFEFENSFNTYLANAFLFDNVFDRYATNFNFGENPYTTFHYDAKLVTNYYQTYHDNFVFGSNPYNTYHYDAKLVKNSYQTYHDNFVFGSNPYSTYHYGFSLSSPKYVPFLSNVSLGVPKYVPFLSNVSLGVPKYIASLNNNISLAEPKFVRLLRNINLVVPRPVIYRDNVKLIGMKYKFHDQIDYLNEFPAPKPVLGPTINWDDNDDLSSAGAFATESAARADAASKNYFKYIIRQILNDRGVIFFTYRVDFDNEIVCNLSTPKIPLYGMMQGG